MKVEVEKAQWNEQVDWTKNPQLVVSDDFIVITSENQSNKLNEESFVGTRIKNGSFSNAWAKEVFKPFHGKITLQND